jgi:UDP-glucose 4-epimerase
LKVLVAGGAGFIGSHLVDELISKGHWVRVLDDFSSGKKINVAKHFASGKLELVEGSVVDRSVVEKAVKGVDSVVDLAGKGNLAKSVEDPLPYHDTNLTGTLNLLNCCVKNGIRKFVFSSSGSVYPENIRGQISEDSPYEPKSPYAATKVCAEIYCKTFRSVYLMETVVLRFFNVYGPRRENSSYGGAVTNFMLNMMRDQPIQLYGDGSDIRDYVYVLDVVKALMLSLTEGVNGEFNVGTGIGTSTLELIRLIGEVVSTEPKIIREKKREGDTPSRVASISKINRVTGFKPGYNLKEGLALLKDYLEAKSREQQFSQ